MRFGLMPVKTGLCHILSRFEVAPCKEMPENIVYETKSFLLQMHGEIRLSFNRIQFWNNIYEGALKISRPKNKKNEFTILKFFYFST